MHRILEYIILFIGVVMCQVLIFSNISMWGYVNVYMYIMFIMLLPMEINKYLLILLGALTGVAMDFINGTAGLYTIATIWAAFVRPGLLSFTAGHDIVENKGVPSPSKLGMRKYTTYSGIFVFLFSTVFFTIEAYSVNSAYIIAMRIVLSTILTTIIIYFCQLPFMRMTAGK